MACGWSYPIPSSSCQSENQPFAWWDDAQDETEARAVHRTLCDLLEQQDPAVLGSDLGQVSLFSQLALRVSSANGFISLYFPYAFFFSTQTASNHVGDFRSTCQVPRVVDVLGQILEAFVHKREETTIVDAPTAQRMGRVLRSMKVRTANNNARWRMLCQNSMF